MTAIHRKKDYPNSREISAALVKAAAGFFRACFLLPFPGRINSPVRNIYLICYLPFSPVHQTGFNINYPFCYQILFLRNTGL